MKIRLINASRAPAPLANYTQAVEVTNPSRILYISGQIPVGMDGAVPSTFGEQCRLAWANVEAQLGAADMTLDNLVKITVFLADRRFALESREVRRAILGDRRPAATVIITGIFDAAWLVEIEAVAVA
jgi:2-iminobutanoate/2-iminopropanoate deaminase